MGKIKVVRKINEESIIQFIFCNIICHFGLQLQIISDNGTQFIGCKVRKFYEESNIKLIFVLVYHPHANKQVEVTNRTIAEILKRKVGKNSRT